MFYGKIRLTIECLTLVKKFTRYGTKPHYRIETSSSEQPVVGHIWKQMWVAKAIAGGEFCVFCRLVIIINKKNMDDLFLVLMLVSFICFMWSLVRPNTFSLIFFNKLQKGGIRLALGLAIPFFFILFGLTTDLRDSQEKNVAEPKKTQEIVEQKQVATETKNETTSQSTPQLPQAVFDVPSLIEKNIDEVKKVLGEPTEFLQPTKQQLALTDIWDMSYTKDDTNLLITYNPKNKIVLDYFIDGNDKAKLLALGNLQEKNDAYITEFVKNVSNSNEILGVKIIKKLPSELDGSVAYNMVAFQISNDEDYNWTDCRFEINSGIISSGYEYKTSSGIKANDKLVIPFSEFTKGGERFNFLTQKPEKIFIACETNGQHRTNYFAIK